MACRIGITADEEERKRYWKSKHSSLRNWKILSRHRTKSAAQTAETKLADEHDCVSSPGGGGKENDNWIVYKFNY